MTTKPKSLPYRDHETATIASFREDSDFAADYLTAVLEDGDEQELQLACRRMARASDEPMR